MKLACALAMGAGAARDGEIDQASEFVEIARALLASLEKSARRHRRVS